MALLDLNQTVGTDYSEIKQLVKTLKDDENCFVGWVDSYNSENGTVNIQPAIQNKVVTDDNTIEYKNKPFLINCWVINNTMAREPQRGDKCLVLVLDEKSNNFFKAQFDESLPLEKQTIINTSKTYKTMSNCVAFIINNQPVQKIEEYIKSIVLEYKNESSEGYFGITTTDQDGTEKGLYFNNNDFDTVATGPLPNDYRYLTLKYGKVKIYTASTTTSGWSSITDDTFKYSQSVSLSSTDEIDDSAVYELINDAPVTFAEYGIILKNIYVSSNNLYATFYAIVKPTSAITLKIAKYRYES